MKMKLILILIVLGLWLLPANKIFSQTRAITELCSQHIVPPFVSNGQQYRAMLKNNETIRFKTTFYGGNTYRVSTYSGLEAGNVIFTVYDEEDNVLYSNSLYNYSPYWDFWFKATMNCSIEVKLNQQKVEAGIVAMLIGYK